MLVKKIYNVVSFKHPYPWPKILAQTVATGFVLTSKTVEKWKSFKKCLALSANTDKTIFAADSQLPRAGGKADKIYFHIVGRVLYLSQNDYLSGAGPPSFTYSHNRANGGPLSSLHDWLMEQRWSSWKTKSLKNWIKVFVSGATSLFTNAGNGSTQAYTISSISSWLKNKPVLGLHKPHLWLSAIRWTV